MTNGQFVRRDIWALELGAAAPPWDPYTLGYARAIAAMQDLASDEPRSWSYQSAMHGTWATPPDPLWNGCQHGSWFFLPWHRMYIWYFERIVRSHVVADGGPADWALPYWNYTTARRAVRPCRPRSASRHCPTAATTRSSFPTETAPRQ